MKVGYAAAGASLAWGFVMAKQVFLSGHGGWKPAQGFTQVPRGCRVHFYTDFAKNLITGMEYRILNGSWTTISRTVQEFMSCPDMLLSPQDATWTARSRRELAARNDPNCFLLVAPPGGRRLSEIFRNVKAGVGYDFHWMACQTLGLTKVGGRAHGLNAGDFAHDPTKPGRYQITNASGAIEWMGG